MIAQTMLQRLLACENVLLTGPSDTDGDSIGACLAVQRALQHHGKSVDVGGVPGPRYEWMPGATAMLPDEQLKEHYDAVVVLDGDRHRLTPSSTAAFENAEFRALIDHHSSTSKEGYTLAWLEPTAPSTCEMVYSALTDWDVPVDKEMATSLFVGSIFDTGGFRYSNTTPHTHRMAIELLETGIDHADICMRVLMERSPISLQLAGKIFSEASYHLDGKVLIGCVLYSDIQNMGLRPNDLEGLVNALLNVSGVEVSSLLIEREPRQFKLSFRSRGRVNVAQIAKSLSPGGGGHAKASGSGFNGDAQACITALLTLLEAELS
jgi:phosphoesterase RecJ-like protein